MQFLQFLFLIHLLFVISPESDDEDSDDYYATNYDYSMTQHKILMHNSSIAVFMQKCYWRVLY